jgi:hypothetical protein
VETRREALGLPIDVPTPRGYGAALNQLEQAVARSDVPAAVGLDNNGRTCPTDARIDNAEKHISRRKPLGIGR